MKSKKTIPSFKSEEEESRWYQKHKADLDDYFDDMNEAETPEISIELRKQILEKAMTDRIGLRIPPILKTILKEAAIKKGFRSYNEFIRQSLTQVALDVLNNDDLKRIASL